MDHRSSSRLCCYEDMCSPRYKELVSLLGEKPGVRRKQWEFFAAVDVLCRRGFISDGSKGLGFAVGLEPLSSFFASRGCLITASDLLSGNDAWLKGNQAATTLDSIYKPEVCDRDAFYRNVSIRHVDMRNIPDDLRQGQFDFIWSSCAFEHLGTIELGIEYVVNSLACLRPGGIAVHTTEFNCSSNKDTIMKGGYVIFRRSDIESIHSRIDGIGRMEPIDYSFGNHEYDMMIDQSPYRPEPHLKLNLSGYVATSILLVITKL